jgi:opacity protein-like surface antigen
MPFGRVGATERLFSSLPFHTMRLAIGLMLFVCCAAHADPATFTFDPVVNAGVQIAPAAPADAPRAKPAFGSKDTWRWQVLLGGMTDFESAEQVEFGISASYFIIDNLSVDFQVEGDYIAQPVANAWGGGGTILFRWHFLAYQTWSLYADAGSGVIATTVNTPSGGTSFNFTPQAGGGVSFDVAEDLRLMVGARWYHISNANTGETNPGRNSLMGYVMLSIPF